MTLRRVFLRMVCVLLVCVTSLGAASTDRPWYRVYDDFLLAPSGAMNAGLYGYDNPALLSYMNNFDVMAQWSDETRRTQDYNNWGMFFGMPHVGFGMIHEEQLGNKIDNYRLSFAVGNKMASGGVGYGWSSGNTSVLNRNTCWSLGLLLRPCSFISIGGTGILENNSAYKEGMFDASLRPFGNEFLTLFSDYAMQDGVPTHNDILKSCGAILEPFKGIRLVSRFFSNDEYSVGVNVSLGSMSMLMNTRYQYGTGARNYSTYGVRMGASEKSLFNRSVLEKQYLKIALHGPVKYRRISFFSPLTSLTLLEFLTLVHAAQRDSTIQGIAIDASGLMLNNEFAYEMRNALIAFRSTGKKVVVYLDYPSLSEYYFASAANTVVMNPNGEMHLDGVLMGRVYYKAALDKLGIGCREIRFLKYKSYAESFVRTNMSDADRLQRQAITDDAFAAIKNEICSSRNMDAAQFDRCCNEGIIFSSEDARNNKLVDVLSSWHDVEDMLKKDERIPVALIEPTALFEKQQPYYTAWGERPVIAVVYALGLCSMDSGVRARVVAEKIDEIAKDPLIRAVIVRVDSPGGDAIAADTIADALGRCKKNKPVIVTQGMVAASGGYWISLGADTIVSSPHTITGSIGVISDWFFDKGFKSKIGLSTDFVKQGAHADLDFGLSALGLTLPDRDMNPDEEKRFEDSMKYTYNTFKNKVAAARGLTPDTVESLAQGRVWSGIDAQENKLTDVVGGFITALAITREKLGLPADAPVTLMEFPRQGFWLTVGMGLNRSIRSDVPLLYEYAQFSFRNNGRPLVMLPVEDISFDEDSKL